MVMRPTRCTLHCPAKINLSLSVGSPDAMGMHPINSWMVPIDLTDRVTLMARGGDRIEACLAFASDAPAAQSIDWPLEKDLAWCAVQALQPIAGESRSTGIDVAKRIPAGAGLGGGSSDAAAALWGMNRLYNLGMNVSQLMPVARTLGSDAMFSLHAVATGGGALVGGYGEQIEPIGMRSTEHLALFLPPLRCATAAVYQAFDAQATSPRRSVAADRIRALAESDRIMPESLFNDLAEAACRVEPRLGQARDDLRETLSRPIHITGSGAAMFAVAESREDAESMASHATHATSIAALAVRVLRAPVDVIEETGQV